MTFTKVCFIRKNTPELRNKLKELGYEPSERVSDDNELCLATGMDKFTTIKNETFDSCNPHTTWNCAGVSDKIRTSKDCDLINIAFEELADSLQKRADKLKSNNKQ